MVPYELMFIMDAGLPEDERRDIANEIEREIIDLGGDVKATKQYDVRSFAYPIEGVNRGEYRIVKYLGDPDENINVELRERLNFRDDVLRYLITNRQEYRERRQKALREKKRRQKEKARAKAKAKAKAEARAKRKKAREEKAEQEAEEQEPEEEAEAATVTATAEEVSSEEEPVESSEAEEESEAEEVEETEVS